MTTNNSPAKQANGPDKVFDFTEQMKSGDAGERLFAKAYSNICPVKSADLRFDFSTNLGTVELKTDLYPMSQTKNFFMERYGDMNAKKSGGPWRSHEDKVDFFVYFYTSDLTFFWFKIPELMAVIDGLTNKRRERWIKNKAWTTLGYVIPRDELSSVTYQTDVFPAPTDPF